MSDPRHDPHLLAEVAANLAAIARKDLEMARSARPSEVPEMLTFARAGAQVSRALSAAALALGEFPGDVRHVPLPSEEPFRCCAERSFDHGEDKGEVVRCERVEGHDADPRDASSHIATLQDGRRVRWFEPGSTVVVGWASRPAPTRPRTW